MLKPQPPGRVLEPLPQAQKEEFLKWVGQDLMLSNAARHIKISRHRLENLMKRGEKDFEEGIDSEFAQLWAETREKQADKISNLLQRIENCEKNWQALQWKLSVCFREDFGVEAEEYKELLAEVKKLREYVERLRNNRLQTQGGTISHGGEIHSESHQEAGCSQEGARRQEGQEDSGQEA